MDHLAAMQLIYVVSNPVQASTDLYKIGRHTGGPKKLVNRYSTPIPNLVVYFSHHVEPSRIVEVETRIQEQLAERRLMANGRKEWFNYPLRTIIDTILTIIDSPGPVAEGYSRFEEEKEESISAKDYIEVFLEMHTVKQAGEFIESREIFQSFLEWYHKMSSSRDKITQNKWTRTLKKLEIATFKDGTIAYLKDRVLK